MTSELEKFQDSLARCTMYCNDKAKDSIDAGSKELHVKRQLETCVTKCVDDHMNTEWLNGCKNKTHIYAVYKKHTSDLKTHID